MEFLDALQTENTYTENGMVTNSSTLNECVNLFFTIGAMRGQDKTRLISLFSKAFNEDALTAMRTLFWVRDVRNGAGERQIFRDIMTYLVNHHTDVLAKNIEYIPFFGRWDDLEVLMNTKLEKAALDLYVNGLKMENGLCAKWIPRKGVVFNKLRSLLNLTPKQLRKTLVSLSKTVEQKMCANNWSDINYSQVPSLAMSRYTKAFSKHDSLGFQEYINSLKKGDVKVNAGALYPYDVTKTMKYGNWELANEQWKALPNFMEGTTERILPVVDVSGSMETPAGNNSNVTCMDVAVSLGLYLSERNEGAFKNAFITFSERPQLQILNGKTLKDRYNQLYTSNWGMSTNLELVFTEILEQAVTHNVPKELMPSKVMILSDMEFNRCVRGDNDSAIKMIRNKYTKAGYDIPQVIFWNIQARSDKNFPVRYDEKGTALISGLSPSIVKSVLGGKNLTPIDVMLETVNSERYSVITV